MKNSPPTRALRAHPDLDQLKRQAKELLAAFRAGDAAAVAEVTEHYRDADPGGFTLHGAQLVFARSHGFDSWPKLKAYVDGVTMERLAAAVRGGELSRVRAMLDARPELVDMTMSYRDEHRALHFAVLERAPEVVRLLMQRGADARVGIYPHRDATAAATIAADRGYDEIVAIIEEEEQRRRAADAASASAASSAPDELCDAIGRGDQGRAIALLEADPALVGARNREGRTPLLVAAAALDEAMVAWLLGRGADPNAPGRAGETPLDAAAASSRVQADSGGRIAGVAGLLRARGAELTPRAAVALGAADWLRARHAQGLLVNPIDWSAGGLLTAAVDQDRPEILTLLLDLGFDPNERVRLAEVDEPHYSQAYPLWHCAAQGKVALAGILLARGADPNAHVDSSGSSVYSAYSHRQWAMVELLKRSGGVVGADIVGLYRETELARQLLAQEAAGTLPPAMAAADRSVAEQLLEFGASGGDPEIVRMALERVDWPREDPRWFWILGNPLSFWHHIPWLYAGNRDFDRSTYAACFRLILERCDPNLRERFGRTMLHDVAAAGDHVTEEEAALFAALLLDAGARVDVRDDIFKSTPLGWACRWGRPAVAKLLLARGADPVEADAEPWARPRAWAEKTGRQDLSALLEKAGR